VEVERKRVVDVGCGTGRHWGKILAREPADLVGYDVSPGMLEKLRQKYPQSTVHLARRYRLWCTPAESCDLVVSTLALSHFASARAAFDEWARVLRAGGDVLVTDLHPAVAARSRTTFRYHEQILSVKTYVRPLASLRAAIARSGLEPVAFSEAPLDDALVSRCERAEMRTVFEKMKGLPFLYGMHLRKPH
jgi:ubiquinone/menaquinone biosynthesis C-methylase UbiE